jgi:hypothetical protein
MISGGNRYPASLIFFIPLPPGRQNDRKPEVP